MFAALRSGCATTLSLARRPLALCASVVLVLLSVCAEARAQVFVGDLDGDGVPEYLALRPVRSADEPVVGQVRVYSGATRALLRSYTSRVSDDAFGLSGCFIGDLNGDGVHDVLIGAPRAVSMEGVPTGRVYALCGATGSTILNIVGEPYSDFGRTVVGLGDMDGDGVPDFASSHRRVDVTGEFVGVVTIHSGVDGATIGALWCDGGSGSFGFAVVGLGDLDDDGEPDLAVSSPLVEREGQQRGEVLVFLSAGGSVMDGRASSSADLRIVNPDLPGAAFGVALIVGRDLNADGVRELVVVSTLSDPGTGVPLAASLRAHDPLTGLRVGDSLVSASALRVDLTGDLIVDERDIVEALLSLGQDPDKHNPINPDVDGDDEVTVNDLMHVLGATPGALSPRALIEPEQAPRVAVALMNFFDALSTCLGVSASDDRIGIGGGMGGIDPPDIDPFAAPITPESIACCIYRLLFWDFPPDLRPPPPPGCNPGEGGPGGGGDDNGGGSGGGNDDDDDDGNGPDCDFNVFGTDTITVGPGSYLYSAIGDTGGTVHWQISPYINTPIVFAGQASGNTVSVRAVRPGSVTLIGVSYRNGRPQCTASITITVLEACDVTLSGPSTVGIGENGTVVAHDIPQGYIAYWSATGPGVVTGTTTNSATVRTIGLGSVRVTLSLRHEGVERCRRDWVINSACVGDVSGPGMLSLGSSAVYTATGLGAMHSVQWSATGGLSIVSTTGNSAVVQAVGCAPGTVRASLRVDNEPTPCVLTREVDVSVSNSPLTLGGIPTEDFVQILPGAPPLAFAVQATGQGTFHWTVNSTDPEAAQWTAFGNVGALLVSRPTRVTVRVQRTHCGTATIERSFVVVGFDLAIDSNNDGVIDALDEEVEDAAPGHVILANTLDYDADGIPDHADGFSFIPGLDDTAVIEGASFSPVRLAMSDLHELPFNAVSFEYDASDPRGVHISDRSFFELPEQGSLRLWTKDAGQTRDPRPVQDGGDFVPSGVATLAHLGLDRTGGEVTLYLEAVRPSAAAGDKAIRAELSVLGVGLGDGSPQQPSPFDLVRATATQIEILGRGRDDTEYYLTEILWPTTLPLEDEPQPESILPGPWERYRIRIIDPRPGIDAIRVHGQEVPVHESDSGYISAEFLCIENDDLGGILPAGVLAVTLPEELTVELEYNPRGKQKRGVGPRRLNADFMMLADLVDQVSLELRDANWAPSNPAYSGAFGDAVHAKVTDALSDNPKFLLNPLIDPESRLLVRYSHSGARGLGQYDVLRVVPGYRPSPGDIIDQNKILFAFEVKTGHGRMSDAQLDYYPRLVDDRWDVVRGKWRWTRDTGWELFRAYRHDYPAMSRSLRGANVVGPALAIEGIIVHSFYGKNDRDTYVNLFVNKMTLAAYASSHAIMRNHADDAFEYLLSYFASFSGSSAGVTLGMVRAMVEYYRRN